MNPNAHLRLFCFPHAGGTTEIFSSWVELVDPTIELALVQLPGRGGRFLEAPIKSMPTMVSEVASALEPMFDLPFAFFGHSMGALIAFELARRMNIRISGLKRLFLSACPAPQRLKRGRRISAMNDEQLIVFLSGMDGTPAEVLQNQELLRMLIPCIRSDFELVELYEFCVRPRLKVPLSLCFGSGDSDTEPADAARWGELTDMGYETRWFEGNHFFIRSEADRVAEWVSESLVSETLPTSYRKS